MTIDRIIFLRIAEDRGIELYGRLQALQNESELYKSLCLLFRDADDKYNSGLFHFTEEKGREGADTLTPKLHIDNEPLRKIIKGIYYPDSPYEFSVLPVEVLGQVYEQFLGKVITIGAERKVTVEEKPEVRKAGGVYYTPQYIVDYIVKHTVGKLLEGRDTKTAATLRVIDPACGSGSFLLGAYQFLLDWHLDQYSKAPEKHKRALYKAANGDWRLTSQERKRILLNNIYGVDLDQQAVEVTKLSLSLRVLEGETAESVGRTTQMFSERALPSLDQNIKCGNSLIGPDFYDSPLAAGLSDEELRRVNAFDWAAEFPIEMSTGGFDAVIGNPPYVRSINLKESYPLVWQLYRTLYLSASLREWDIYLIFVEKGIALLRSDGKLGYILPNKFLNSQVGENLRGMLSEGRYLEHLVHFGAFQIFKNATTYTCLLFLSQEGRECVTAMRYVGPIKQSGAVCPLPEDAPALWRASTVPAASLTADVWEFSASDSGVMDRLKQQPALENVAEVFKGTGTNADKVYLLENRGQEGELVRVFSPEKDAEYLLEPTLLKPALRGRNIGRYELDGPPLLLLVPYKTVGTKKVLILEDELAVLAPRTLAYLRECRPRLDERENGRFIGPGWYGFGRPQNLDRFEVTEKIVMPDVVNRGVCYLDRGERWLLDTAYSIVLKGERSLDLRFVLGVLNTPILTYFLKETGSALRGGYFRMKTAYLNPFPLPAIDFNDPADTARHDQLVSLVEKMLDLHKRLPGARTPQDKTLLQRQIGATDKQIDALVYALYGLSAEEIAVVEAATTKTASS